MDLTTTEMAFNTNFEMTTLSSTLNERVNFTTATLLATRLTSSAPEELRFCHYPLYYIKLTSLAVVMTMMITTLALISCRRRLRKQRHIFPYNLILADLCGAVVLATFEGFKGAEPPDGVYMFLTILLATSHMVSLLSIVLVAGFQFVTIRVDPFGSKHTITSPRLIAACTLTWGISFACSSPVAFINKMANNSDGSGDSLYIVLLPLSLATTVIAGTCYLFIYRSIAKVPCGHSSITAERKEQNQRVLRTFGLVFGTSFLCWICPWVSWTQQIMGYEDKCLVETADVMIIINWIANLIIYWWRLNEFRSIFLSTCPGHRNNHQFSLNTDAKTYSVVTQKSLNGPTKTTAL